VSSLRYELSSYITADGILRSHPRENLISYIAEEYGREKDHNKVIDIGVGVGVEPTFAHSYFRCRLW
jgi:hypothetical protein